jgi:hypothetical protein
VLVLHSEQKQTHGEREAVAAAGSDATTSAVLVVKKHGCEIQAVPVGKMKVVLVASRKQQRHMQSGCLLEIGLQPSALRSAKCLAQVDRRFDHCPFYNLIGAKPATTLLAAVLCQTKPVTEAFRRCAKLGHIEQSQGFPGSPSTLKSTEKQTQHADRFPFRKNTTSFP